MVDQITPLFWSRGAAHAAEAPPRFCRSGPRWQHALRQQRLRRWGNQLFAPVKEIWGGGRGAGAYPSRFGVRGGAHPGQVASSSQGERKTGLLRFRSDFVQERVITFKTWFKETERNYKSILKPWWPTVEFIVTTDIQPSIFKWGQRLAVEFYWKPKSISYWKHIDYTDTCLKHIDDVNKVNL